MKKKITLITAIFVVALFLTSCTAGVNVAEKVPNSQEYLAGFFRGLWHGFILLFSFIGSLFNDTISIYEVHNSGGLYDLGFLIGASTFFGGSGRAGKRRCKKERY
ncbi:hypothetical protein EW093_03825 [Thiospirochaeta perfilievii]|uniref:Lipoprotein n=1 Tax=Thiospirochaeta perfilievii TaxID=252967 RepID=A0A5C1QB26_9SPIO|nr:hypothetical protein [Thiospirochaeta perfilievii]QEN03864.1 hypothetical protein EW093_03825 [Thiospirochaeta perfilievii]